MFSNWPTFSNEEIQAVQQVLASGKVNYWTGDECKLFEKEFAEAVGVNFAIALANGTVALDLALRALNIGVGDDVVVTSRTFLASVSSIINVGARPIFADVDILTQNISASTIERVITDKTKAIMCVHLAGLACPMDEIMCLAEQRDCLVIEDCAQAHGAKYKGNSVGSIGHVGCWSFCQDKIMTTGGEGGMVTTNNEPLWKKMWSYKDHGKGWDVVHNVKHPFGFRWLHETFGTNFRMTEMQAAIGRIQLKKLPMWNAARRRNLDAIESAAARCPGLSVPRRSCNEDALKCERQICSCVHAAYKAYIYVDGEKQERDRAIEKINELGVPAFVGSCSEVYLEKAFDNTDYRPAERLRNAQLLGDCSIMFLCDPTITEDNIQKTCNAITQVFAHNDL